MNGSRGGALLPILVFVCLASACGAAREGSNQTSSAANYPAENTNVAKSNVEELGMLVNVPYEAEDIVWKEDAAHKRLIAVLRFSSADADKVVAEALPHGTPQQVTLSSETWFPAELIAQSDMTGDNLLHATAYAGDAFYQEPYTSGRVLRVEGTDYFVLELSKK
jgi:hypothetical protein